MQSHGLTGVQARHHDGHDYMQEKREALEVLRRQVNRRATPDQERSTVSGAARQAGQAVLRATDVREHGWSPQLLIRLHQAGKL